MMEYLHYGLLDTIIPMPKSNPDTVLDSLNDASMKRQYQAELSYLRGDYALAVRSFDETGKEDKTIFCAAMLSMIVAVSTNHYELFSEIDEFLSKCIHEGTEEERFLAEIVQSTISVSMYAPNLLPEWLKKGDFTKVPKEAKPMVLYLYAKYLSNIGAYESMFSVAHTAVILLEKEDTFTQLDIYMRLLCAIACHYMKKVEPGKIWLKSAMDLALPHGFVTPFAEMVVAVDESFEEMVLKDYPNQRDAIFEGWEYIWKNWIAFHNRYTKDNITVVLSRKEYQIALLIANGISYHEMSKRLHLAEGTLRNYASIIYAKLFVKNRKELSELVL